MEQVTSLDGTRITYTRRGSGPPLLLVHGTTADRTRWATVSPAFEQQYTVYAVDRRGRGASGDAPVYAIEREFEDVAAVVDAIGPADVVAHSYGAICSLEAALLTDKIGRLVLYEPPLPTGIPMYAPEVLDRMQAHLEKGEREAALLIFFREVVRMPEEELGRFRTLPVWESRIGLAPTIPREVRVDEVYHFSPERWREMRTPTLLLLGSESPAPFRRAIEAVAAAVPDSRIVELGGQRHAAMDGAPELFVAEVLRFLQP